jgi:DNA-binding transcriptional regulator YhcF (GntR family)
MNNTNNQYDQIITTCRNTFIKKTADYGTSWRVYRTLSVADQIYIKARRIRNIQEGVNQKIADDIKSEFEGIVNYAIIGLIQLEINNDEPEDLAVDIVQSMYEQKATAAKDLMLAKNNDYGEAWRNMSQVSLVDLILAKILRIKQIVANEGATLISEGMDANFYDILNYAIFALILIKEEKH